MVGFECPYHFMVSPPLTLLSQNDKRMVPRSLPPPKNLGQKAKKNPLRWLTSHQKPSRLFSILSKCTHKCNKISRYAITTWLNNFCTWFRPFWKENSPPTWDTCDHLGTALQVPISWYKSIEASLCLHLKVHAPVEWQVHNMCSQLKFF